jgi:demethylmenaquinone methyltransferase/2-methoxy-6-polyprenyl-1,4-benzoquinol methylase
MIRNEDIISTILTLGGIRKGMDVLDVACGTGVLFPDYLAREVNSLTAIDISPEMAKLAAAKFPQAKVICGDVETTEFEKLFDAVMVYNAFHHFPDPAKLIARLASLTKPGGRLTVAHGMSRAALQAHHSGRASQVSIDLIHEQELAALMAPWFEVDVVVSTDRMYQVSGVRREVTAHSHGGHVHSHSHGDHDHHHGAGDTPMEELLALMKYMVGHNDAHAQELAELADQLRQTGRVGAHQKLMDAVADFDMANARLDAVFSELNREI